MRRVDYGPSDGFLPLPLFEELDLLRWPRRLGRFVHAPTP
jgi:hypothetical protein